MGLGNNKELSKYMAKINKQTTTSDGTYRGGSQDQTLIKFKAGNTYQFKLIYWFDDKSTRREPFIHRYTHNYWDSEQKVGGNVVCPTSEYEQGNGGFDSCPTCKQLNKWYKEYKDEGNFTSKELYDTFRRQFNGYALVYVINDPSNEDNNGTVKIMRYGLGIRDYLQKNIFGVTYRKDDKTVVDTYGESAFNFTDSFDLIVDVTDKHTENGTFNNYDLRFSTRPNSMDIDIDAIVEQCKELEFDEAFYRPFVKEETESFYSDYVIGNYIKEETAGADEGIETLEEPEPVKQPTSLGSKPKTGTSKPVQEVEEKITGDDDEVDFDEIMSIIEAD